MFATYIVFAILAAAANIYMATNDLIRDKQVLANATSVGLPLSWVPTMGVLKAAGALGLLVGIGVPGIGVAAAVGLTLFYVLAVLSHLRANLALSTYTWPGTYLLLAMGSLVFRLASL